MTPEEVFRLAAEDPNEWIPPKEAAEAIRAAVAEEATRVREELWGNPAWVHALVERWLIAYQEGRAEPGDCVEIMRNITAAVAAVAREREAILRVGQTLRDEHAVTHEEAAGIDRYRERIRARGVT